MISFWLLFGVTALGRLILCLLHLFLDLMQQSHGPESSASSSQQHRGSQWRGQPTITTRQRVAQQEARKKAAS